MARLVRNAVQPDRARLPTRDLDMSVMREFLKLAKGLYIWIDVPSCDILLEGKVITFDRKHIMLSCEAGLFAVCIEDIAHASLTVQSEIVAPS